MTLRAEGGGGVRPVLFVAALLAILVLACAFRPYLNHDVALYLTGAQEVLEGAQPGRDFVDTNPPLILLLSVVPVVLFWWTGWHILAAVQVSLFALLAWSLLVSRRLLQARPFDLSTAERSTLASFWLLATLWIYASSDFGQREQLFVWLVTPFILLRAARHLGHESGWPLSVQVGLAAFLGAGLKPTFAVTLLVLELVQLLRSRRWRSLLAPEVMALGIGAAAYAAYLLTSEGMVDHLRTWTPLILGGYAAYEAPAEEVLGELTSQPLHLAGLGLALVGAYVSRSGGAVGRLVGLASLAWGLSAGFFLLQAKGWSYQLIPATHATLALVGLAALVALRGASGDTAPGGARPGGLVTATLASLVVVGFATVPGLPWALRTGPSWQNAGPLPTLLDQLTGPRDRVMFLDTDLHPAYPATTLAGRRPGTRFSCLWPLPMLYHGTSGYSHPRDPAREGRFYADLVEDVDRRKPRMVIVNARRGCQACPEFFSVDGYLEHRGFYRTALQDYAEVPALPGFRVFVGPPT